jgi:uncharacterized membrane protein (DUF2068 family)
MADSARRLDGLRFIALLKFGKATLLLITFFGAHQLLKPEVATAIYDWSTTLTDGALRDYVLRFLDWLTGPGMAAVTKVQWITFGYMLLVLIEGMGLWKHQTWAEWLVVVAGAVLIPVEIWKLFSAGSNKLIVAAALTMNVAIVWYLVVLLQRNRKARRHMRFKVR